MQHFKKCFLLYQIILYWLTFLKKQKLTECQSLEIEQHDETPVATKDVESSIEQNTKTCLDPQFYNYD